MGFLNDNVTAFSPLLTIERVDAALQEKTVDDISNGDIIIEPDEGFNGLSKVKAAGVYYSPRGFLYTKIFRPRANCGDYYEGSAELEKVIYDNKSVQVVDMSNFRNCANLRQLIFEDGAKVYWQGEGHFTGSPVKYMHIGNINNGYSIIEAWAGVTESLTNLVDVTIWQGYDFETLELYSSPNLAADCLRNIINNLASGMSGNVLWIGETNIAKLSQEYIDIATSKGWDVM